MRSTSRIFAASAAFFAAVAAVYWAIAHEPAGTLMFILWGVALLFGSLYLRAGARRAVAGDDPDRRPDQVAGEWVGVFRAGSAWPVVLAVGLTVTLAGLVYGLWLVVPGTLATIAALVGLMHESAARPDRL